MSRAILAALPATGVLLLAGAAQAKIPPTGIDLCGPTACVHLDWTAVTSFWTRGSSGPSTPAPFYVARWQWGGQPEQKAYYVPDRRALRFFTPGDAFPTWSSLGDDELARLRQAVGIEAFPVPRLTRVTIGGRVARAPQTYVRLFQGKPVSSYPATPWLRVRLQSATPSPWTDSPTQIWLARRGPFVEIDSWMYHLPRGVAERARRGLSLSG